MTDHLRSQLHDIDPQETKEWLEAYDAVVREHGKDRAHYILISLMRRMRVENVELPSLIQTPYINTIPPEDEPPYPGDEDIELRIRRYIRWNAVAMVMRANSHFPSIGGHLSTYASAATLIEVGFHHFFRGKEDGHGDQIFFQGHASPGIYGRAFLEGRLTEEHLLHFRREVGGGGLSSYPHPWLMPDFWEFPTVSMGLGPIAAIYQARFNRYLQARGVANTEGSRVWAFLGDGECDEPESLGALHLASRERLGNLIFVVNCNLQRLDGPVRGNGKIIQELEAVFHGAGWNVIKVIWGKEWDDLLARDTDGILVRRMGEMVDGQYQKYSVEDGAYTRNHFFASDPRLMKLVEHLSDNEIHHLRRGGHDFQKVYAAYKRATRELDRPTVVLAKTIKGWSLGEGAEGRNVTHQQKKMSLREIKAFRDRLELDVPDDQLHEPPFLKFEEGSDELDYMLQRRGALGGPVPTRTSRHFSMPPADPDAFQQFLTGSGGRDVSTTMAFARLLASLMDDDEIGQRIVPIIPDEARSFGLDTLFNKYGIYSSVGQLYEPVDANFLLSYREARNGQVLEEGICEAGSMASFIAAGSSHASFGEPMIPFYIFYSMFGFQRTGDQVWAAGDQRCRGFMLGATAGRTTLMGEGLQHCDGHSLLTASSFPHVRAYEPAYAYELAVIIREGLRRMSEEQEDGIYYITLQNEQYDMPAIPKDAEQGILEGLYLLKAGKGKAKKKRVQLLGSGSILREVLRAQEILQDQFKVPADVWSATSYQQLRNDALDAERWNRLHPTDERRVPKVQQLLGDTSGPVIAASDWVQAVPEQIARWVPGMSALGTDGFGRSDTRANLRRHFEVDAPSIVIASLSQLANRGVIDHAEVAEAISTLGVDPDKENPRVV